MAPWAQFLYACDGKWWNHHKGVPEFKGEKWTQLEDNKTDHKWIKDHGLNYMPGKHAKGLGHDCLHYGSNSGYQAINLAWLLSKGTVSQIVLLGYDMQTTGGKKHWFGDHPDGPMNVLSGYDGFIRHFTDLAADLEHEGVDVVNCTRETALTCFRRDSLENVL